VIVVDDCSADATAEVAEGYGVRVLRNPQNLGEGGARNAGIRAATQPWLAFLDSDDEWLPRHLDVLWNARADHVLVSGSCLWRGSDGRDIRLAGAVSDEPCVLESPAPLVYPENFVTASGVMVRRDDVLAVDGFREGMPLGADLDLWVRLLERGTGVVLPDPVTVYHVHEGQVTSDRTLARRRHVALIRGYADRSWASDALIERSVGVMIYDEFRQEVAARRWKAAAGQLRRLFRHPARLFGVAGIVARRARLQRRFAAVQG
jgi:glycosyltransferase involved in cell wall biosynthesis